METNKEKVIKELRRVFCAPCTTANSCVGCLVDIAEEAVNASQQSVHPTNGGQCAICGQSEDGHYKQNHLYVPAIRG